MKKAIYKVPNGKLLKIFLEEADGKIISVKITGDFFAYPEESIEFLEADLRGAPLVKEELEKKIQEHMEASKATYFGMDAASLAHTIVSAA